MITPKIIFEDDSLLVLDKPAGMIVNKSQTVRDLLTLQDWIGQYLGIRDRGIGERAGIVHRLDKETSGIILVAKTQESFENLQMQFKNREVQKKYIALAHGKIVPKASTIRASIGRSPFNRKKFGVFLGGKEAETAYEVIKYYFEKKLGFFSLLEIIPKTGRTHQIRVHLKFIGYPVAGDKTYAGRKIAKQDQQWMERQFLHASQIMIKHPKTGKEIEFTSSLPLELKKSLETLQESTKALN